MERSHLRKLADAAVKLLAVIGGALLALAVSALLIALHVLSGDETAYYRDDGGIFWDLTFLAVPLTIYGCLIAPGVWRRTYVTSGPRRASDDECEAAFGRGVAPYDSPFSPLFTEGDFIGREFFGGGERRDVRAWFDVVGQSPAVAPARPIGCTLPIRGIGASSPHPSHEAAPAPEAYGVPSERPTVLGGFACIAPVADDAAIPPPEPLIERRAGVREPESDADDRF